MELYLSGAESRWRELVELGCKTLSISYWHLKWLPKDKLKKMFDIFEENGVKFLLAYGSMPTNSAPKDWVSEYVTWLKDNKLSDRPDILYSDVNNHSYEKHKSIYADLDPSKLIIKYHREKDVNKLKRIGRDYSYIGLEGNYTIEEYQYFMSHGNFINQKTKIHCWNMSKKDIIYQMPFDSISSSNWLMGNKYGVTYVYHKEYGWRSYNAKNTEIKESLKPKFEEYNLDWHKFMNKDRVEIDKWNALQFVKWAEDLKQLKKERINLALIDTHFKKFNEHKMETVELKDDKRHLVVKNCDNCYIKINCPKAKAGQSCIYNRGVEFKKDGIPLNELILRLFEIQINRVQQAVMFENIEGGYPTTMVNEMINSMFQNLKVCKNIMSKDDKEAIIVKGKGIISKIFGKDVNF